MEQMRTIMDFAVTVRDEVIQRLGVEDHQGEVGEILKNNGIHIVGLTIRRTGVSIAPVIYLDRFWHRYCMGRTDLSSLIREIIEIYEASQCDHEVDESLITDYERARERICYKLINADKNAILLKNTPHKMICGDMAMIFFISMYLKEEEGASVTIRNDLMEQWGVTLDELYEIAVENTEKLFPGTIRSMSEVIRGLLEYQFDDTEDIEKLDTYFSEEENDGIMYVCTNSVQMHGAGVVFYPGFLKELSEEKECDFYVLPASVHEMILIPVSNDIDVDYLGSMVRDINANHVSPIDVLSDIVYIYHRGTDQIDMA